MQMVPHPGDERQEEFYYLVNIQELPHLAWSGIPTNDFKCHSFNSRSTFTLNRLVPFESLLLVQFPAILISG